MRLSPHAFEDAQEELSFQSWRTRKPDGLFCSCLFVVDVIQLVLGCLSGQCPSTAPALRAATNGIIIASLALLSESSYQYIRGPVVLLFRVFSAFGLGLSVRPDQGRFSSAIFEARLLYPSIASAFFANPPYWYWLGSVLCFVTAVLVDTAVPYSVCEGSFSCQLSVLSASFQRPAELLQAALQSRAAWLHSLNLLLAGLLLHVLEIKARHAWDMHQRAQYAVSQAGASAVSASPPASAGGSFSSVKATRFPDMAHGITHPSSLEPASAAEPASSSTPSPSPAAAESSSARPAAAAAAAAGSISRTPPAAAAPQCPAGAAAGCEKGSASVLQHIPVEPHRPVMKLKTFAIKLRPPSGIAVDAEGMSKKTCVAAKLPGKV